MSFAELCNRMLPLNRKERYYTATVLPGIICTENFKYFGRFLKLLNLGSARFDVADNVNIQFFTEYGLAEALVDKVRSQASTPTGGRHLIYEAKNGAVYRNNVRLNGSAIDLRTIGGYIVLPTGNNGRAWLKPLATPLAPAPKWVAPAPTAEARPQGAQRPFARETPYAHAALASACLAVEEAPDGVQETTLNKKCYSIGGLISGGELDTEAAIEALTAAAGRMPQYAEPWRDLGAKVRRAVEEGMQRPRARADESAVAITDFAAYMQTHDYIFMPAGDFWPAARVDARLPPVKLRQERLADHGLEDRRAKANTREPMARQKCAGRATDMVPRIAAIDPSPASERRRLGRTQKRNRIEPVPPAAPESRRRGEG